MRSPFQRPNPKLRDALLGVPRAAAVVALAAVLFPVPALAQGSAFTYQGRLSDNARPANGTYDLSFSLYPQATDGSRIGPVLSFPATPVTNGLFSLSLDFGQGSFNGQDRWIELAVRTNGAPSFSTLSPRRPVLASPQAQFATAAANAQAVPASGVSGVLSLANLPPLAADGSLLTGLNASQLASGSVPDARLSANVPLLNAPRPSPAPIASMAPSSPNILPTPSPEPLPAMRPRSST